MAAVTRYTYAQLEQLWVNAGGPASAAPVAAAIAEAESGGNPQATNPTDNYGTQTSWGLWQISDGTHSQPVPGILDPVTNAQAAVAKYKASGWSPWGTYQSGAYTAFLSNSTPPDPSGVPAGPGTATLTSASQTPCLVSLPSVGPVGGGCFFTKSNARAWVGGLCIAAAGLIAIPAVLLLAAAGFQRAAPAVSGLAGGLERTPGYGTVIRQARHRSAMRAAQQQGQQQGQLAAARAAARKQAKAKAAGTP
jgi:Lysozyme like domain